MNTAIIFILHINQQLFILLLCLSCSDILRQECQSAKHEDFAGETGKRGGELETKACLLK